jgi:hypothetical protein
VVESSTLKSTLYQNKESKHHEYNRKNQESRMRNASIAVQSLCTRPVGAAGKPLSFRSNRPLVMFLRRLWGPLGDLLGLETMFSVPIESL